MGFQVFSSILYVCLVLCVPITAASAQNSSKSTLKTSSPSKRSKNKSAKQRAALSQGYSASEALLMSDNPWSFIADTSISRGFDEYADTLNSTTSLSANYKINSFSVLGLALGYETIAKNHDGSLFNSKDSSPDRYGLTDLAINYSLPNIWKPTKKLALTYSGQMKFATSKTSQRATMRGRLTKTAILRYRPASKLLLSFSGGLTVASFRYDCQTVTCTQFGAAAPNSPLGISYRASASYNVFTWLSAGASYGHFQRYDYLDNWRTIQTASAFLNFNVTSSVGVYAAMRWRDLTISNDEMFDDDKSLAFLGVSYAF